MDDPQLYHPTTEGSKMAKAFVLMLQKSQDKSFVLFSINKRNFHEKKHLLEARVFWWLSGQKLEKICKKGLLILGNRGSKIQKNQ